jgi:hypothetical protein
MGRFLADIQGQAASEPVLLPGALALEYHRVEALDHAIKWGNANAVMSMTHESLRNSLVSGVALAGYFRRESYGLQVGYVVT